MSYNFVKTEIKITGGRGKLKIGITEAGDAGIDFSWVQKIKDVDAAILITKDLNDTFINNVMYLYQTGHKIIVHCTCTGFGGTVVEPNVPDMYHQLNQLAMLLNRGFPITQCVLRIDPIIPTKRGLQRVNAVLNYAEHLGFIGVFSNQKYGSSIRIRISILDQYSHVIERLFNNNLPALYDGDFQASDAQLMNTVLTLRKYQAIYETCAESTLVNLVRVVVKISNISFQEVGCISEKDITILGLSGAYNGSTNPQNRSGCKCLSCKIELLNNKRQCHHGCLYCYWR